MYASRMSSTDFCGVLKPTSSRKFVELDALFMTSGELALAVAESHGELGRADERQRPEGSAAGGGGSKGANNFFKNSKSLSVGVSPEAVVQKYFATSTAARFGGGVGRDNTAQLRRDILKSVYTAVSPGRMAATIVDGGTICGGLELGGYWGAVLRPLGAHSADTALVSTVSNSTRSHSWIKDVGDKFNLACTGRLMDGARGYLTSEIARGGFVEKEDAEEVLEDIRCIADLYDVDEV